MLKCSHTLIIYSRVRVAMADMQVSDRQLLLYIAHAAFHLSSMAFGARPSHHQNAGVFGGGRRALKCVGPCVNMTRHTTNGNNCTHTREPTGMREHTRAHIHTGTVSHTHHTATHTHYTASLQHTPPQLTDS